MNDQIEHVINAEIAGVHFKFFIADAIDTIQCHHRLGKFYESEELELISRHFRPGGSFLDVGANVGNHSIFASKLLNASRLILVEPNPEALTILFRNLALNGLDGQTTVVHQCAFSDQEGFGHIVPAQRHNLGAAQVRRLTEFKRDAGSSVIRCVRGDDIISHEPVDFLKIDVEGHAIHVLRGLNRTIAVNRPPIFVEIDDADLLDFEGWLVERRYTIVDRFVRYATQANFIILPAERVWPNRNHGAKY